MKLIDVLRLIKIAAGVAGGAVILSENHPYLAVCILVVGAVANEWIAIIRE